MNENSSNIISVSFRRGSSAGYIADFSEHAEVQGTCKYGTRVDYILASPNCPYKFVPGSYAVVSSKGTSDHHIVKADITINSSCVASRRQRQRVVRMSNGTTKGIWAAT